ncbi:MAG: PepSY domain-containing protein [Flavobacteriaceae bacterium]|nr:PepSY domain-containing protein [Flavobacteriaceae bacterium]
MVKNPTRKKQAKILRGFRKVHRTMGATLFVFFFIISVSGFLLGWKKNSFGVLQSNTQQGSSTKFTQWLPLDSLKNNAIFYLQKEVENSQTLEIKRIDVSETKGVVKFIFTEYYGVQLDGSTGNLLLLERRYSDLIEELHDGSALDTYFKTTGNPIKLIYTTLMSIALLLFTVTGFWLWLGPKRMRKRQ